MKTKTFFLLILLLAAVLFFSSCNTKNLKPPVLPTTAPQKTTKFYSSELNTIAPTEKSTARVTSKTDDGDSEIQTIPEPENTKPSLNLTSKGFAITEIGGVTYIDGIVIANKTYSLPENYNPCAGELVPECKAAFDALQAAAKEQGLNLYIGSGFRSFALQTNIYNRYVSRDGSDMADTYSARPGHSEHQTGLAIDLNDISSSFANTAEGVWVTKNAWRYGFILRYQRGKELQTGYMYEPWHIRYVGREKAEKIYNSGLCLEEYYGITSVYNY